MNISSSLGAKYSPFPFFRKRAQGKHYMDMEIVLSFVVLAVMDCPISAHSFINKIPLHIIPHDFLRKFVAPFVGE